MSDTRAWLDVPFSENEWAKSQGAKFDKNVKRWYDPSGGSIKLKRWLPLLPGVFTVEWIMEHGRRRTFKLLRSSTQSAKNEMVAMYLTGPDNENDYTVGGWISGGQFDSRRPSRDQIMNDMNDFLAARRDALTDTPKMHTATNVRLLRSTHCIRCGRRLTTPDSIRSGMGPECIRYLNGCAT